MSLKRSSQGSSTRSSAGDSGSKVGRQELFDKLKSLHAQSQVFTPTDVSLSIGAGEPQVSRALLGLAAEGCLEKVEVGKYRVLDAFVELSMAEFLKTFNRAFKADSSRAKELSEITRLKQNNDIMRAKLLQAIAERDHYLGALKRHGIDPGPAPTPVAAAEVVAPPVPTGGTSDASPGSGA